tara:strand:+ start:90 stop:206 length:117 start_codon:yes stop_codon:yes gene_type:complete
MKLKMIKVFFAKDKFFLAMNLRDLKDGFLEQKYKKEEK